MYEIGPFRLDPEAAVLTRDGEPMPLGSRAVAVLTELVRRANEHVQKSAIIDAAWRGMVVEEGNLSVQISAIRRVLRSAPGGEAWLETLPRRGYRFVGPVRALPSAARAAAKSNLPRALTSFVGRERELVSIKQLLGTARLLTITGAGGIGKTRLAGQAAAEVVDAYRDGVWFVDLARVAQHDLVAGAIAQALGVRSSLGRTLTDAIDERLEARQVLLMLDNCEHVLEACAAIAERLLRRHAGLCIVATSREPLHVEGEQAMPLAPLSLPARAGTLHDVTASEAVQLFLDRARRHQPAFELTPASAPAVARLCTHLDGIPLALELAAARVRSLSVEQIDRRLDDRFRLLTAEGRSAVPRHQTLGAMMDWSYELLSEDKRAVLRRCAVFAGAFTLDAATAVTAFGRIAAEQVIDLLAQLVDRSLLVADTASPEPRYRLLETTRAYALEKLRTAGELQLARRRHAESFATQIERAADAWLLETETEWSARHLPLLDDVHAALDWSIGQGHDAILGARLAGGAGPAWAVLGTLKESTGWLDAATQDVKPDTPATAGARLWLWRGVRHEGAPEQAELCFERAASLYRECGDGLGLANTMTEWSRALMKMGRYEQARPLLVASWPAIRQSGAAKALAVYHSAAGFLKTETGDVAGARIEYLEAMVQFRRAGAEIPALVMLANLANLAWTQGDLAQAAASYEENIRVRLESRDSRRSALGWARCNYAGVLTEMGRLDEALEQGRLGLPLLAEGGYFWLVADHFALRAARAGQLEAAARLAGYADARNAERNATRQTNEARARARLQAHLEAALDERERAQLVDEGRAMSEVEAVELALAR